MNEKQYFLSEYLNLYFIKLKNKTSFYLYFIYNFLPPFATICHHLPPFATICHRLPPFCHTISATPFCHCKNSLSKLKKEV
jgi:hypothetical protein